MTVDLKFPCHKNKKIISYHNNRQNHFHEVYPANSGDVVFKNKVKINPKWKLNAGETIVLMAMKNYKKYKKQNVKNKLPQEEIIKYLRVFLKTLFNCVPRRGHTNTQQVSTKLFSFNEIYNSTEFQPRWIYKEICQLHW